MSVTRKAIEDAIIKRLLDQVPSLKYVLPWTGPLSATTQLKQPPSAWVLFDSTNHTPVDPATYREEETYLVMIAVRDLRHDHDGYAVIEAIEQALAGTTLGLSIEPVMLQKTELIAADKGTVLYQVSIRIDRDRTTTWEGYV